MQERRATAALTVGRRAASARSWLAARGPWWTGPGRPRPSRRCSMPVERWCR